MIEKLQDDYVLYARVKGLKEKTVIKKYAMKNSLISFVAYLSVVFPHILSIMVPIDVAFGIKCIGDLFVQALFHLDYSIMIALVFVYGVIIIIFNLIADILYAIVDPRITYEKKKYH